EPRHRQGEPGRNDGAGLRRRGGRWADRRDPPRPGKGAVGRVPGADAGGVQANDGRMPARGRGSRTENELTAEAVAGEDRPLRIADCGLEEWSSIRNPQSAIRNPP